jgi:cell division transport system permease protein
MPRPTARRGPLARAWSQMRADLWLQGVAVTTLTVALAIVGAYMTLCLNLGQAGQKLAAGSSLVVALSDQASLEQGQALAKSLAAQPGVAQARLVSRQQALERFRQQLGPQASLLEGLEENPLPHILEIFLAPGAGDPQALAAKLSGQPLVDEVLTSRPWLHRLESSALSLAEAAWVLGGLLFMGVVLLVANTVRLAVYARRERLEILELVGATGAYLRLPFLLEALLQALAGALLASALVWLLLRLMRAPAELPLGLDLSDLVRFPWQVPLALLCLAALAALLGGMLGVGRALRGRGLE